MDRRHGIPTTILVSVIAIAFLVSLKIYWPITEPEHIEAISTTILGFVISAIVHWYMSIFR
jgi:hypothetical protein